MRRFGGLDCHLRNEETRGVPLLRPFKKIGLAPASAACVAGFRAVFSNTAVIRHKPASEDTSVSLVHWQEPYSHRGRVLADCSQLPGLRRLPGASRTIDLGSSPAPFKRLRPFKESAAQQLLKPAMAGFKPFKPQAPQGPPF